MAEVVLDCLERALKGSESLLSQVLSKAKFWEEQKGKSLNERQQKIINLLLDGFSGSLTSSKWAALCKCSQDTASRDIENLIHLKILRKNPDGGRSTSYSLIL